MSSEANGSTKIVTDHAGDRVVVWSRLLKWLPSIATAAVLAILAQGFLMWREQAVANTLMGHAQLDIIELRKDLTEHVKAAEGTYVTKAEWLDARKATDDKLVDGLAGIERELGYIHTGQRIVIDRTTHNQSILEKLPVPEEKR